MTTKGDGYCGIQGLGFNTPYDEGSDSSNTNEETMVLLVNKFIKFLKKIKAFRKFQRKESIDSTKKGKNTKENITCHECGKGGHMNVEKDKKESWDIKAKKAYIVWNIPKEEATSSTPDDEKSTKLCLMTQNHETCKTSKQGNSSEVRISDSDYDSDCSLTYDVLYELKKLTKINANRKTVILVHEKNILEIQKFIELQLQHETLDLIYTNST
ncbi:hypothetical protein Lal_00039666, partial [Lupinus albus]